MATSTNQQQPRGFNKRSVSKTESNVNSWIIKIGENKKTAEELIEAIMFEIEAPSCFYKRINEILYHLKKIIKFFYSSLDVKVELFGSSDTKLATKDSDVDIYLNFGENLQKPLEVFMRSFKNKVRKFGFFRNSIFISAKVPIVRCVHRNGISCDLSFKNALGVANSHLIKFLLSLDKRFKPLILILKYLLKSQELIGNNAFSSFSLICLIVFFLQTHKDPILPNICYLQNLSTEKRLVSNWDTSFTTDVSYLPVVRNQLSVTELLQKFFEFYSTFEFGFYIISLFTGKKYLKPIFCDSALLSEEFKLYKTNLAKNYKFDCNAFMCVQCPFDHSNNVTKRASQKSVLLFQNLCCTNAAIGQELLKRDHSEENKIKYLMKLFNQESQISKRKRLKAEDIVIFVGDNITSEDCNCTEDSLRNEWSKRIFNTLKDVLCKIMKCDIDVQSKASGNESVCLFSDEKLIKCKLHYHGLITKKRNEVRSVINIPQNVSDIEKEEIVSDYLCDTVLKDTNKTTLKFTITCYAKTKPTCFCMSLKSEETQKGNIHLVVQIFQFIHNYFPKWIK